MESFFPSARGPLNDSLQVELLGTPDWDTRTRAFDSLQQEGTAALDALVTGTTHTNWRVRRNCADLLDHLADDRCAASLVRLLRDPVESVRRLAVHALSCQGCKVCPLNVDIVAHLIEQVRVDRNVRVRRVAVHQLGCQPPDTRAANFLRALLREESDAGILSRARWALEKQESGSDAPNKGG